MEEKEITPQQSLDLIQSMIGKAKNTLADNGFYIIFWGWLVLTAALINYVLVKLNIEYGYYIWLLMPLGAIVSWIYGNKAAKTVKVKTYIDDYLTYLWIGFGIGLAITIFMIGVHGVKTTYFFLMILYGLATFVSGGALKFKPLIIGSFFSFAAAIGSVFSGDDEQFLWIAFALLCSYIIPGHLLKNKFKSQQNV